MNLVIGIVSLTIAFLVRINKRPIKNILLSKILGFDIYINPIPQEIKYYIVFPFFICGLYFLWKVDLWYSITAFAIWIIFNFLETAKNSDGAKATRIFNIYRRIKSDGIERNENTLVKKAAYEYCLRKKFHLNYIEQKITQIPSECTENIWELVQFILMEETDDYISALSFEERNKRKKIIKYCYKRVFKEDPPFYFE